MIRPSALIVVAWLFIISGVGAILSMVIVLFTAQGIHVDLSAANLWIGVGLLNLEARWHRWAVIMLRLEVATTAIAIILLAYDKPVVAVKIFRHPIGQISRTTGIVAVIAIAAACVWQYAVLQRPQVRVLFASAQTPGKAVPPAP